MVREIPWPGVRAAYRKPVLTGASSVFLGGILKRAGKGSVTVCSRLSHVNRVPEGS